MLSEQIKPDAFMQVQQRTQPISSTMIRPATQPDIPRAAGGFSAVLQQTLQQPNTPPLTFSGHALQRMQQRQINLSMNETQALTEAVSRARSKGAKETLILADRAAFVVSVQNSTVITVMDRDNLKDNVFTQIDSAIVI